jgi:hypothetical protein
LKQNDPIRDAASVGVAVAMTAATVVAGISAMFALPTMPGLLLLTGWGWYDAWRRYHRGTP